MDADNSGTIDRLEWLAYLCSTGVDGAEAKGGKDYYDFELRAMFEDVDINKDGCIQQKELIEFLKLYMK